MNLIDDRALSDVGSRDLKFGVTGILLVVGIAIAMAIIF